MNTKELLREALRLPEAERAALAGELIESLETEVDADAEASWAVEIRLRLRELNEGRAHTVPWSEARRRIRLAAQGGARS